MKTEELADELKVGLVLVKTLLRRHFPDENFRPPGKTLSAAQVQRVREQMPVLMRERRDQGGDVEASDDEAPLPAGVEAMASAPLRRAAAPRRGGAYRLLVHTTVFDFLTETSGDRRRLRAHVKRLMREMLVDGRAARRVKGTRGVNAGWLRAPLGDNGGSHFYLWHALAGTKRLAGLALAPGAVVLRCVRHHDDHEVLAPGELSDYTEMDAHEYASTFEDDEQLEVADPLSERQRAAHDRDATASITKGHPGAGKTTLQLERTRRLTGKLLFLTFGAAQREHAERWLKTYEPEGLACEAWTHERLFQTLDPGWTPGLRVGAAIEELQTALRPVRSQLGPWRDHLPGLYAELRAHYWGRALPFEFRDRGAVVDEASRELGYRQRREGLGVAIVDGAVQAARALPSAVRERLFGDLERLAARALALHDEATLPDALVGWSGVLIDEVQDLTLVEALVCVLVARASAKRSGVRPIFHAAGDEGQTVRATDFDWGELKDLVSNLIGAPDEIELPGNVRSPRTLAQIINNSWSLYRSMGKSARPRGHAEAQLDEFAIGSVLWVDVGTSLAQALAVVEKTPGAVLIHPGPQVPDELRRAADAAAIVHTMAAPDVKGLDFRVAFVLDVGRASHDLFRRAASGAADPLVELDNRQTADAIRVAISRATEVLVFLETRLDDDVRARLAALCSVGGELLDGVVTDQPVATLAGAVDVDWSDRTALVTEALADFDRTFADDAVAGLRLAERSRQWLGDAGRSGAIQGDLRRQVYWSYARALMATALLPSLPWTEARDRLTQANREFRHAKELELARLCLDVRDTLDPEGKDPVRPFALVARRAAGPVADGRAEAGAIVTRCLDALLPRMTGFQVSAWTQLVDLIGDLRTRHAALVPAAAQQQLAEEAAAWAIASKVTKAGTQLLERAIELLADPSAAVRAVLAERSDRPAQAIALYREAGDPGQALRVSRAHGDDPQRSARLATETGDPARETVERLDRLDRDLRALVPSELTEGERDTLVRALRDKFPRR